AKDAGSWELRRRHGVRADVLDAAGIRELEPSAGPQYRVGVFMPEQGAVTEPFRYASALTQVLLQQGASFAKERVRGLTPRAGGWDVHGETRSRHVKHVVIAAGIRSSSLLAPLGWKVPLESQRGYHLHLARPNLTVSRPVVLADRKVFIVPMETGLRVSGTVEFGGLSMPPTPRRAHMLGVAAQEGLPGLQLDGQASTWMGHRPCLPDSLPVIGPVPRREGLWCAFGHGHLGVTGSINTGRILSAALRGEADTQHLAAFSVARFGGA
ncbi:FAD-binding oxidoreductase, partial [Oxalobacteraceae bacterium OM1]